MPHPFLAVFHGFFRGLLPPKVWSLLATAVLFFSATIGVAQAQTSLSVGDIQVLGATSDANDSFTFVLWQDIGAGTVLRFMDHSFTSAAGTTINSTENDMALTFNGALTAGTVIRVENSGNTLVNGANAGSSITKTGSLSGISNDGDQVFIYQGDAENGNTFTPRTLLYGLNVANTNWLTSGSADAQNSYLPTAISGIDANFDSGNFDNVGYTGARTGLTEAIYRAAVSSITNYTQNDTRFDLDGTAFTINASASLHWDANGSTANNGGGGTWDTTTADRFKNGASGTTYFRWVNSSTGNNHTAVFGGTAGTVSVASGGVTASGLQFDVSGYIIQNNTVTLSGSATPTITVTTSGHTATINSLLAGSGGFTKAGAGTLILSGANTGLSGTVTHNGGVLEMTTATALGNSTLAFGGYNKLVANVPDGTSWTVANGMTLPSTGTGGEGELIRIGDATPTAGTTLRLTGVIGGGAAGQTYTLLDSDQGSNHNNVLILDNAANTFTGTIETWRGTLAITSDGALGNAANTLKLNNGSNNGGLRFDANNITLAATRTISLTGSEAINTQANNAVINSTITGSALRKNGSGMLTLGGTNTYTGTTDIQAGTLRVTGGSAISNAGTVSLANVAGATFELQASETIGALSGGGTTGGSVNLNGNTLSLSSTSAISFAGVISGTGGVLAKTATGVLTLSGTNTYTGGTNLNAGSLNISNGAALGTGDLNVNTTATGTFLQVANTAAVALANNIVLPAPGSAQRVDLIKNAASASTGTQLNLTGQISGGSANLTLRVTTDTAGDTTTTYRFAGNNSFAGKVELYRGAIVVASPTGLGTATLQLNGNNNSTLGDLRFESSMTFANNIELVNTANPDPIHTNGNTVVLTGVVSSSGDENLVKIGSGTLVLAGANTYTVGTTISAGALQVGNGGTTGSLGSTSGVVNNSSLIVNRSDAYALTPVISGSGSLTQAGAGTTTVSGTNTFSGDVSITGGTLAVGTVAAAGTAQPLGQGTTAVAVSGGGRLQYTGTAANWDRGITVAGGAGTVQNTGSGALTLTGPINHNGVSLAFTGTQPIAVNGTITGSTGSDVEVDGSSVILGGANTYAGTTQVTNGGKLAAANTSGSATGSGDVEVIGTGSTILGTGIISPAAGGSVTLGSGARVVVGTEGASAGQTLTFTPASGSMTTTFQSGSILEIDLFSGAGQGDNSGSSTAADVFRWGGGLALESGVKLRVTNATSMTGFQIGDTWKLLDWTTFSGAAPTGTFDAAMLELPQLTGLDWDLSNLYTAGTVTVMVPEPGRFFLLLPGLCHLLLRRRRSRSRRLTEA